MGINKGSVSFAQYGEQALQEPLSQVRPRQPSVPYLREQARSDPQVQHQHLPPVLPRVREGHRLCQVPLSAFSKYHILMLGEDFAAGDRWGVALCGFSWMPQILSWRTLSVLILNIKLADPSKKKIFPPKKKKKKKKKKK